MVRASRFAAVASLGMLLVLACQADEAVRPAENQANYPPIAHIEGPPSLREGAYPNPLFSARRSTDPDGDSLTYTWLPGDGRTFSGAVGTRDQGWNYADNGTYTVSVIVTDPYGAADTASHTLTVVNASPHATQVFPPLQQAAGIQASTRVTFVDSGSVDSQTVLIRWGDGTSDSLRHYGPYWEADTVRHSYAQPGSYWVRAVVRDKDGGVDSAAATTPVIVIDATAREPVAGYEVFDLGTLGGNHAVTNDINDRGEVVGSSLTSSGATHAFLWQNGVLKDLGTLGQPSSEAHRISETGLIAGMVRNDEDLWESRAAAAIWRGTDGQVIGNLETFRIRAVQVTANDQVVWNRGGYEDVYGWLWRGNSWQSLGKLWVSAVNEKGQIVGAAPVHSWGESRIYHAFVWEVGEKRDLGVLGVHGGCDFDDCSAARATDVNERGQIVGISTDSVGNTHIVQWENGTIRDLGLIGDRLLSHSAAYALINERGEIAATVDGRSYYWRGGTWHPIGSGTDSSNVVAINDAGMVVGTRMTPEHEQHVFVWSEDRGFVDLGTGPHGFTAAWPVDINARGDIVGYTAPCRFDSWWNFCWRPQEARAVIWRKPS